MPSDVIEAHVSRLPPLAEDDWTPRAVDRTSLERALLAGGVAGTATHPIDNVRGNIQQLLDHDPDKEFGLTGLQEGMTLDRVLGLVERAAGSPIDRNARFGPVEIRARPIVDESVAAGQRLARASQNGETLVFATGHPTGLAYLYHELAGELARRGASILILGRGVRWREPGLDHDWFIEHHDGVAMLSDGRECWIGESPSIGKRRAIIDVLRAGNGSAIAKSIARLEAIEAGILKAQEDAAHADLLATADDLGIDLSK